ncbi:MAG: hypothetical protein J7K98_02500 [Candidatus Aenigmarchaeota archaeon]|nr:hypothetical protein [Candidatus Aenigmarchaeota archaeon]
MGLLRNLTGLYLIVIAWFDLLGLSFTWRIVIFLIGFDLMSFWFKAFIFGVDYLFFEFLGRLSWGMVLLIVVDIVARYVLPLGILIKPGIIFLIMYFSGFHLYISVGIAVVDLIINLKR